MSLVALLCHADDFCKVFEPHYRAALMVFSDQGELLDFMLTAGHVHDIKALPRLAGRLFGNKGYISTALFESHRVQLITKLKRNMKNQLMPLADRLLLRKRTIAETIIRVVAR